MKEAKIRTIIELENEVIAARKALREYGSQSALLVDTLEKTIRDEILEFIETCYLPIPQEIVSEHDASISYPPRKHIIREMVDSLARTLTKMMLDAHRDVPVRDSRFDEVE